MKAGTRARTRAKTKIRPALRIVPRAGVVMAMMMMVLIVDMCHPK